MKKSTLFKTVTSVPLTAASVADNKNCVFQSFFLLGELNKFTVFCG
jgi:hypothetical protein